MKPNRKLIILLISGYIAPLFFSVTSTVFIGFSVICGLLLFEENRVMTCHVSALTDSEKMRKTAFTVILIIIALALRLMFSLGMTDSGLTVGGFNILPTFTILYYCAAGLFFEINNSDRKAFGIKYLVIFIPAVICFIMAHKAAGNETATAAEAFSEIWNCVFIAAVCEELFFRSAVYRALSEAWGRRAAAIASASAFALWHLNLVIPLIHYFSFMVFMNLLTVFMLGIITAVIYEKCGIVCSIIFHAVNNGLVIYMLDLTDIIL